VDRFHDIVGHTHKLIVHGWWMKESRHMALDNLRGIAQTVRECYRGALGQDVWGRAALMLMKEKVRAHMSSQDG
jgi:hypothetical protein